MKCLFREVEDNTAGELALVHEGHDSVNVVKLIDLDVVVDLATLEEAKGLNHIHTGTDNGTTDGNTLHNSRDDIKGEVTRGKTNERHGTTTADSTESLAESNVGDSGDNAAVNTTNSVLDSLGNVSLDGVVSVSSTKSLSVLDLLVIDINTDDVEAHSLGELDTKLAETTETGDQNPVTSLSVGDLKTLVDGKTGTEDRSDVRKINTLRDTSNVVRVSDAVLSKSTVDAVTSVLLLGAKSLPTRVAVLAVTASAVQPRNTDEVANLDVLNLSTSLNNTADTLVTGGEGESGLNGPVTLPGVVISTADTSVSDSDENLFRTRLGDGNLLNLQRLTELGDDSGFHSRRHS